MNSQRRVSRHDMITTEQSIHIKDLCLIGTSGQVIFGQ